MCNTVWPQLCLQGMVPELSTKTLCAVVCHSTVSIFHKSKFHIVWGHRGGWGFHTHMGGGGGRGAQSTGPMKQPCKSPHGKSTVWSLVLLTSESPPIFSNIFSVPSLQQLLIWQVLLSLEMQAASQLKAFCFEAPQGKPTFHPFFSSTALGGYLGGHHRMQ